MCIPHKLLYMVHIYMYVHITAEAMTPNLVTVKVPYLSIIYSLNNRVYLLMATHNPGTRECLKQLNTYSSINEFCLTNC